MPAMVDTDPGFRIPTPAPGEEVVITGLSGRFPESDNTAQFRDNLLNKVDMVTDDDRRWKIDHPDIPHMIGKMNGLEKFDASFFGVHYKQAHTMDPACRMLLERAYEACLDAGMSPRELKGSNAGVFIGTSFCESEKTWFYERLSAVNGFGITGCSRAMLANRISYWLGITGPSYQIDAGHSSSANCLEQAYRAIRDGHCESALVGGSNYCLHPYVAMQVCKLGVLSEERCKPFDKHANGYNRAEAVVMVLLQKAKAAKRIYATVVHAKNYCHLYSDLGPTVPLPSMQEQMYREFYQECGVEPTELGYLEASATGHAITDYDELTSIGKVFCKGRTTPLLIGSVKSNMGHAEPVSGLCSLVKVIIAMESGRIPPAIHYETPREDVPSIVSGELKVVTENQPWDGGLVGVNSFGLGGSSCHMLLRWNAKAKVDGGVPGDALPRLVVASGRTEEAVRVILEDVESRPVDVEFVKLLHEVHKTEMTGHIYRGFTLLSSGDRDIKSIKNFPGARRPIWFVFSGMGSQWPAMGRQLMNFPLFAASIAKADRVLRPRGLDIVKIITEQDGHMFDNILNSFVGIAAIQVALVDILTEMGIEPDGIVGHSVGELGCAYADGSFTADQMVLAAYSRGKASIETEFIRGSMAAVGLGYKEAKYLVPKEIEIACRNGPNSCTISGPSEDVQRFVAKLKSENIFAREVSCSNIAYHSRYIAKAGPKLLQYLKEVIPEPKKRSSKWVSSSVPQNMWNTPLAKYSSAEYHTNNLLQSVLFEEASRSIPQNAIAIEIAPHGLLQAILRKSLNSNVINIPLTLRGHADNVEFLFTAIGKMYENGMQLDLARLYPEVPFPVSRGTPMFSPLIRWEHTDDWWLSSFKMQEKVTSGERRVQINLANKGKEFYAGHILDGRNLFPSTGYLVEVWDLIGQMTNKSLKKSNVVFENVQFLQPTNIPKEGGIELSIMVHKGSGNFEVRDGEMVVVTGRVYVPGHMDEELISDIPQQPGPKLGSYRVGTQDAYHELELRGYEYSGEFRGIISSEETGRTGTVRWADNWVTFIESLLQLHTLTDDTRDLHIVKSIGKLVVDVERHEAQVQAAGAGKGIPVAIHRNIEVVKTAGVEIRAIRTDPVAKQRPLKSLVLGREQFVAHFSGAVQDMELQEALRTCMQLAIENRPGDEVKIVELAGNSKQLMVPIVLDILQEFPSVQPDITVLASTNKWDRGELAAAIAIESRDLSGCRDCNLVLGTDVLGNEQVLRKAAEAVGVGGCVVTREMHAADITPRPDMEAVLDLSTRSGRFVMFRKRSPLQSVAVIRISEAHFNWLPNVQKALKMQQRVILLAEQEPTNGIIGLVNSIRKEPAGEKFRCVFVLDRKAPPFSLTTPLYKDQLVKDLAINVYKDGHWGSYRHLALPPNPQVFPHIFVNMPRRGDISSLRWLEGSLNPATTNIKPTEEMVNIYYSALNKNSDSSFTGPSKEEDGQFQECRQGMEYSGRTTGTGRRVMGVVGRGALSTLVVGDRDLMWDVPDTWSLEDAATVPLAYGIAYYSLVIRGRMRPKETVLIHRGAGGVGLAAIRISLHAGCKVFTTVGSQEERAYVQQQFPQLHENHIGNSRDTSFEQMVLLETGGAGVDVVLNCLPERGLVASLRCIAVRGRFLQLGRQELSNKTSIGMNIFLKAVTFASVIFDNLVSGPSGAKQRLRNLVQAGIESGVVKPLRRTVFGEDQVKEAFRYAASGSHLGKVVVRVQEEDASSSSKQARTLKKGTARFYCDPNQTYVVTYGVGDFGLELAHWLVTRKARKILLTSRNGLETGYQTSRVHSWRGYGCDVRISTADVATEAGVARLLEEAGRLGPVGGIFSSAADGGAATTAHLDAASRRLCPALRRFVVFTGGAAHTVQAVTNSTADRICEARVREGLPGLAVQWGGVALQGHGSATDGMRNQSWCLSVLDTFLCQSHPVLSAVVLNQRSLDRGGGGSIVNHVADIIGIADVKKVDPRSTLRQLGMDDVMSVEVRQALERRFEISRTLRSLGKMTFQDLADLGTTRGDDNLQESQHKRINDDLSGAPFQGLGLLVQGLVDESLMMEQLTKLSLKNRTTSELPLYVLPGLDGVSSLLQGIVDDIEVPAYSLQPGFDPGLSSIEQMAASAIQHIRYRQPKGAFFYLLGYSFGGVLALEVAHALEKDGAVGQVFLVDSSPDFLRVLARMRARGRSLEDSLQVNVLGRMADLVTADRITELTEELFKLGTWEERLECFLGHVPKTATSRKYLSTVATCIYRRARTLADHKPRYKLRSGVTLLRPSQISIRIDSDYGLSKICERKVKVQFVEGTHLAVLGSKRPAAIVGMAIGETNRMTNDLIGAILIEDEDLNKIRNRSKT